MLHYEMACMMFQRSGPGYSEENAWTPALRCVAQRGHLQEKETCRKRSNTVEREVEVILGVGVTDQHPILGSNITSIMGNNT